MGREHKVCLSITLAALQSAFLSLFWGFYETAAFKDYIRNDLIPFIGQEYTKQGVNRFAMSS